MTSRRRNLGLAALGIAAAAHAQAPAPAPERFDIAITVDDLPAHGELPPGMTRLGIAQSYLATLKAHGVPEAFGFVNGSRLDKEPGTASVLAAWRQAGYPLGNHTWSHMNLERAPSFAAWQADAIAGEPAVAAAMGPSDWHWLRMPNLAMSARREQALAFMHARGYRLADVSVAFGDWSYTDAYARCVAKGDQAAIAAMQRQYLRNVDRGIADMKAQSRQVFGRVIPQVLLTHLGGWSAVTLPEVMKRLDAAGAHYVTLAQAESDPAYALQGGGSLIARAARDKGIKLTSVANKDDEPELDLRALCR
jgi:peptidoglycan/xylan/chitin deacetylase (PgdA/CDA1 family)